LHREIGLLRERFAATLPTLPDNLMTKAADDLWVFGYGSLMWRPGFDFLERHEGRPDRRPPGAVCLFLRPPRHARKSLVSCSASITAAPAAAFAYRVRAKKRDGHDRVSA
jgi:hypothetical protein